MTAHKHAALMLQYAQDAMETDKPWLRWEHTFNARWYGCDQHPSWDREIEYRRKPHTMTYTVTIPEPLREAPESQQRYFMASPASSAYCNAFRWYGGRTDTRLLKRGLCFATKEDAIAAAKAMLPIKEEV